MTELFDTPAESGVKCLGCGAWFTGLSELRAEDWRHADGCDRPGELFC
jgi:hypothetical protein